MEGITTPQRIIITNMLMFVQARDNIKTKKKTPDGIKYSILRMMGPHNHNHNDTHIHVVVVTFGRCVGRDDVKPIRQLRKLKFNVCFTTPLESDF